MECQGMNEIIIEIKNSVKVMNQLKRNQETGKQIWKKLHNIAQSYKEIENMSVFKRQRIEPEGPTLISSEFQKEITENGEKHSDTSQLKNFQNLQKNPKIFRFRKPNKFPTR